VLTIWFSKLRGGGGGLFREYMGGKRARKKRSLYCDPLCGFGKIPVHMDSKSASLDRGLFKVYMWASSSARKNSPKRTGYKVKFS